MEESYFDTTAADRRRPELPLIDDVSGTSSFARRDCGQADGCPGNDVHASTYELASKSSCDKKAGKRILSYEEISRHRDLHDAWIIVNGKVYDVTPFLRAHPGGAEIILQFLQSAAVKDAGPLMRGELEEADHIHSINSLRMLDQFLIGSLENVSSSAPTETSYGKKYRYDVDLTKPIVAQVGFLGADYDEWIHDPIITTESPRFFESDLFEFFTKTKWWAIPAVWCPLAFTLLYKAVVEEKVPLAKMPFFFVLGLMIWTILEYIIHRFIFHMKTSSSWGNKFHYVIHGFHHKHPMDVERLVFPPLLTSVVCYALWVFFGTWIIPYRLKLAIYPSALLGYVSYDLVHYYLHSGSARGIKRYHLNHHFKDHENGYGITTKIWDYIFSTVPPAIRSNENITGD